MDVTCDFGWVFWGRLGTSWGVLGASSLVCVAIFWMVLDGLDGLLMSFESMLARCLNLLWSNWRFEDSLRVSERFPRCASAASRE